MVLFFHRVILREKEPSEVELRTGWRAIVSHQSVHFIVILIVLFLWRLEHMKALDLVPSWRWKEIGKALA